MKVVNLNHFLIRSADLEKSREFFEHIVGLHVGPRPPFRFPGYWMYSEAGHPLVHLAAAGTGDSELKRYLGAPRGTGAAGSVDHISFLCGELPAFERRLTDHQWRYVGRTVLEEGLHQVFVEGPDGIRFEFMFPSHEAASWSCDGAGVSDDAPLNGEN